jgi:hypothetical protein
MKLDTLNLTRGYSGDQPLHGKAIFSTPDDHKIELVLSEADAIAIVEICAEAIASIGKKAAEALTADALRFTAIEHKSEDKF